MKKYIKNIITIIVLVPWSIVILLLIQIKSILLDYSSTNKIDTIVRVDTIIKDTTIIPKFKQQTPKEGLKEALVYYNIKHKDIVYAQAILETGHFTSRVCNDNNNLFGLYNSRKKQYYKFENWWNSIIFYKRNIQNRYNDSIDYYTFLEKINYAESKTYIKTLKTIINDTRRYT